MPDLLEATEFIRKYAAEFGLHGFVDQIVSYIKPAVFLRWRPCPQVDFSLAVTRFGGEPDLPPGFIWPLTFDGRPQKFVMQIALSDLVPMRLDLGLPTNGLLSVFVDDHDGLPDRNVTFTHEGVTLERTSLPAALLAEYGDDDVLLNSHEVKLIRGLQLPGTPPLSFGSWRESEGGFLKACEFFECFNERFGVDARGRLGGYANTALGNVQWHMFVDEAERLGEPVRSENAIHHNLAVESRQKLFALYDQIQLLLELDWFEGYMCFMAMRDQAKHIDIDNVVAFYMCS